MRWAALFALAVTVLCATQPAFASTKIGINAKAVAPKGQDNSSRPVTPIVSGIPIGSDTIPSCATCGPVINRPELGLVALIRFSEADGRSALCSGIFVTGDRVLTAGHCGCGIPASYMIEAPGGSHAVGRPKFSLIAPPALYDPESCAAGLAPGRDLALLAIGGKLECGKAGPLAPAQAIPVLRTKDAHEFMVKAPLGRGHCAEFGQIETILGQPAPSVWVVRESLLRTHYKVYAAGYGLSEFDPAGGVLRSGALPPVSIACENPGLAQTCVAFAEMVLADTTDTANRMDTCPGDSGGPVFAYRNGKAVLIAITSRPAFVYPDDSGLPCGGGGVYELVGRKSVYEWLRANGVAAAPLATGPDQLATAKPPARAVAARKRANTVATAQSPFGGLIPLDARR